MSLEQEAADAERVKQFLEDAAVIAAFDRIDKQLFEKFKEATTDDDRRNLSAVAQACGLLGRELRVTVSTGDRARHELGQQQKKAEQEKERAKRLAGRF